MPERIKTFDPSPKTVTPDRAADIAFYKSKRWRDLREVKLKTDPLCQCPDCDAGRKKLTPANQVHHMIDRKERPDLAFTMSNLQSLAGRCHSRITRERQLRIIEEIHEKMSDNKKGE